MKKIEFLDYVEGFLKTTGMSATTFGIKAVNDSRIVFMLREGRECREETQARVLDFINNYQEEKNND